MPNYKSHDCHHVFRQIPYFIGLLTLIFSGCQPAIISTATDIPATSTAREIVETQPISDGPVLLRSGISLRSFAQTDAGSIKLALHPQTGDLYILSPISGLHRLKMDPASSVENVANPTDIVDDASLSGMVFGPMAPYSLLPIVLKKGSITRL